MLVEPQCLDALCVRGELRCAGADEEPVAELAESTRPLGYTTLSQIENGARRVDVDDLMALAIALDVPPNDLLMPFAESDEVEVTLTGAQPVSALQAWYFLNGMRSLRDTGIEFAVRALPSFLSVRRTALASTSRLSADRELWISRRLETNGDRVNHRLAQALGSELETEDDD